MTNFSFEVDAFAQAGLSNLAVEAFGPLGFAKGDDEVFRRLVFRDPDTLGWGQIKSTTGSRPMGLDGNKFSREALEL